LINFVDRSQRVNHYARPPAIERVDRVHLPALRPSQPSWTVCVRLYRLVSSTHAIAICY